jgi:hypothetical protein
MLFTHVFHPLNQWPMTVITRIFSWTRLTRVKTSMPLSLRWWGRPRFMVARKPKIQWAAKCYNNGDVMWEIVWDIIWYNEMIWHIYITKWYDIYITKPSIDGYVIYLILSHEISHTWVCLPQNEWADPPFCPPWFTSEAKRGLNSMRNSGTWELPGLVNVQKTMENHHFFNG